LLSDANQAGKDVKAELAFLKESKKLFEELNALQGNTLVFIQNELKERLAIYDVMEDITPEQRKQNRLVALAIADIKTQNFLLDEQERENQKTNKALEERVDILLRMGKIAEAVNLQVIQAGISDMANPFFGAVQEMVRMGDVFGGMENSPMKDRMILKFPPMDPNMERFQREIFLNKETLQAQVLELSKMLALLEKEGLARTGIAESIREERDGLIVILESQRNMLSLVDPELAKRDELLVINKEIAAALDNQLITQMSSIEKAEELMKLNKERIARIVKLETFGSFAPLVQSLDDAFQQGASSGLNRALHDVIEGGDFKSFIISFGQSISDALISALVSAFVNVAAKNAVTGFLTIMGSLGAHGGTVTPQGGIVRMAAGGTVPNFGRPFADSVPALLMPGERVLTRAEAKNHQAAGATTLNFTANVQSLDPSNSAEVILREMPAIQSALIDSYNSNSRFRRETTR
jgi:hypothetical protein